MKKLIAIILSVLTLCCVFAACKQPTQPADQVLQNGSYLCDVSITGGNGNARIKSPTSILVRSQECTATIIWLSGKCEYIKIGENVFKPTNNPSGQTIIDDSGSSKTYPTFQIPVKLDIDIAISAFAEDGGEAKLIDYTLHFDSSTLKTGNSTSRQ